MDHERASGITVKGTADLAYVACGGGRVTTFAGRAVDVSGPSDILSSNGRIGILLEDELLPL